MQQSGGAQQGGHRGTVVKEVGADVIAKLDQISLAAVDAYPGAGMHARGGEVFGGAAGEDVDVLPVQRAVTLVGFGLPDPRALLGGVLGAEREHRGERLVLAEHGDRPEAEIAGVHHAELRQVQRAVRLDPLDQHGQFVHVRHDPRPRAGPETSSGGDGRAPRVVARWASRRYSRSGCRRRRSTCHRRRVAVRGHTRPVPRLPGRTARRSTTALAEVFGGVLVTRRHRVPFCQFQPYRRRLGRGARRFAELVQVVAARGIAARC